MCLFSAATCSTQCELHSLGVNARKPALLYTFRESLASLSIAMALMCDGSLVCACAALQHVRDEPEGEVNVREVPDARLQQGTLGEPGSDDARPRCDERYR